MLTEDQKAKRALRNQMRKLLGQMSPGARAEGSTQVCSKLKQQTAWREAELILFFAPLREEVDVWPLLVSALTSSRKAALPRFDAACNSYVPCLIEDLTQDLVSGKFGIREPAPHCATIPAGSVDLILIPAAAFDLRGYRLGRGRGFYDRLLASVGGKKWGVAFDEQVVSTVPDEPHDVPLDCLVTPTRWIEIRSRPASNSGA
jgi:5-formyltetrahydrofolate cyclo-ligase